jgi:hypothetical protein
MTARSSLELPVTCQMTETSETLIQRFSPLLIYTSDEPYFPVGIQEYLQQCTLITPTEAIATPSSADLWKVYCSLGQPTDRNEQYYLQFMTGWQEQLRGHEKQAPIYAKVTEYASYYDLLYIVLSACTTPYALCGCRSCLYPQGAHLSDVKHLTVRVDKKYLALQKVYFGAHGYQCGEWRDATDVATVGSHICAFACHGDHSFYPEAGNHPRICGCVNDVTADQLVCDTVPQLIRDKSDPLFDPATSGWCYWPGLMAEQGVSAPALQPWFQQESEVSNNWWRRFFCPSWW